MLRVTGFVVWLVFTAAACAQGYPSRAVKVVVPWPPSEIQKIMQSPDMKERYLALGMEPASMTPDDMSAFLRNEQARYGAIIRNAKIKIEQ